MPVPFSPELAIAALRALSPHAGRDTAADRDRVFASLREAHPGVDGRVVDEHVATARQVLRRIRATADAVVQGDTAEDATARLLAVFRYLPEEPIRDAFVLALDAARAALDER